MNKKNKKLCIEAKVVWEQFVKISMKKYCLTLEIDSYTDLSCLFSTLVHISQQSLFLKEEKVE